jgi:glutathione S-transferase
MAERLTLHHFILDPASRLVRLTLGEKKIAYEEQLVRYWEPQPDFEALNPSGLTPVLVVDGLPLCETAAICGWAEELKPFPPLLSDDWTERAEARRLVQWFERKFDYEVNALLLHEKMEKRLMRLGSPDMNAMRAGREALRQHLGYLETLLAERNWLAGQRLSFADFAAAAHLSVHDYLDEVPWKDFKLVRTWYSRIKSRPAFRSLLSDKQPAMPPSTHYHDLDF